MSSETVFRIVLLSSMLPSVVVSISSEFLHQSLPIELQQYLAGQADEVVGLTLTEMVSFGVLMIGFVAVLAGLWFFKWWAKIFYVPLTIAGLVFGAVSGPAVMTGWENMLFALMNMLSGALIAMMFSEGLSERFRKPAA